MDTGKARIKIKRGSNPGDDEYRKRKRWPPIRSQDRGREAEDGKGSDGVGTTGAGLKAQSDRIHRRAYPTNSTASHSRKMML